LDLRGDWTGAQQWYAKAVNLTPSNAILLLRQKEKAPNGRGPSGLDVA
jgi:hypothetical protein